MMKTKRQIANVESLEPRQMLRGGPELVYDFNTEPTAESDFDSIPDHAWLNDQMLFAASDEAGDVELWRTDGTTEGTVRVKDIHVGNASSQPRSFMAGESQVFFVANRNELWVTDGTDGGTREVRTLPDRNEFRDTQALVFDDELLFEIEGGLWKSNGTAAGTVLVKQVAAEEQIRYATFRDFGSMNGKVYFTAGGNSSRNIWETDGTELGTSKVVNNFGASWPKYTGDLIGYVDHETGLSAAKLYNTTTVETITVDLPVETSVYDRWISVDDQLMISRTSNETGETTLLSVDATGDVTTLFDTESSLSHEVVGDTLYVESSFRIWQTDGTVGGTTELELGGERFNFLGADNENVYLSKYDQDSRGWNQIWRWNSDNLTRITFGDADSSAKIYVGSNSGKTFFWTQDGLWISNDSATSAELLDVSITGRTHDGLLGYYQIYNDEDAISMLSLDDRLLVATDGPDGEGQLWHTMAQTKETRRVESALKLDLHSELHPINGGALFAAFDGQSERLWWTDGDVTRPFGIDGPFDWFHAVGDQLFFTQIASDGEPALFRVDASSQQRQPELLLKRPGLNPVDIATIGDSSLFILEQEDVEQLWSTSANELNLLATSDPESTSGDEMELIPAGEQVFFRFDNQLWRTDGTTPGTIQLMADLGRRRLYQNNWQELLEDDLLFVSRASYTDELWRSDGTKQGTVKVSPSTDEARTRRIELIETTSNDVFYFNQESDVSGSTDQLAELWMSDGTAEGSRFVSNGFDFRGGYSFWHPAQATSVGETIYFRDPEHVSELWRTDGTADGTIRYDINPAGSSEPKYMTEHDGYVYFRADDGFHGAELWRVPVELPEPELIPGDTNADGNVDFTDFLALSANFGRDDADGFSVGDFNDDNVVDFADFLILSDNFGNERRSAGTSTSNGGVA